MKTALKSTLIIIAVLSVIVVAISIKVWREDITAKENKIHVSKLIGVRQKLSEAENIVQRMGFRLMYDEAITPTASKDYLQQIVIIGETQPNIFETFAYVTQFAWVPFTHKESQYVVINATLDGLITEIK